MPVEVRLSCLEWSKVVINQVLSNSTGGVQLKVSVYVLLIVLILVLPMSAVVVTSQGPEPDNLSFPQHGMVIGNLAPNPSFEEGNTQPDGWFGVLGGATYTWNSSVAHTGIHSVCISNIEPDHSVEWATISFTPVQPETDYRAGVWVRGDSDREAYLSIAFKDASGSWLFGQSVALPYDNSAWSYTERVFHPPTAASSMRLTLGVNNPGGFTASSVCFDDVLLEVTTTPPPERLPIVFVHGWLGLPGGNCGLPQPNSYFERLDDDLRDNGYHVEYAVLESSPCYTPPLVENVGELKQAIESAKAATGQDKVILIAHSMGGLVSRAYIESPDYGHDVQAIFTLGSPHLGVPVEWLAFLAPTTLALWCATSQPVVCEFSQPGMWIFNRQHPNRAPGVIYHAISGDAPLYPRTSLAAAAYYLLPYGDDGAVETFSATGLSGWVDRWITDEVHGSGSGPRNYFIRDGGQSVSYNYCLKPVLVDNSTDTCGTFSDLRSSAELATTPVQRTPLEYGVLFPGQSRTHQVSLEGGQTLFAAQWQTGTLELTLLDPVGHVIDPQYAVDHPGIVTYEADDLMATYHFPDATAGSWNMVLNAASVPPDGSAFTSFAAFESALALTAGVDRLWYAPNTTATITAALSASPASAIVTATLSYADGLTETAELLPLGGQVYGTHLTIPDVPGYVDLRVAATGTTATGAAFERGLATAFQIAPANADLTDAYTDTPVPRSQGSAFYQALAVTVGVESTLTGRLGLSADLIDDQGNLVAHTYSSEEVVPGTHTLELLFDGDDIYASGHDGPYTLTHLLLTDQTGMTLAILEADDVHITTAYDHRSFSRGQVYLPLVLRGFSGVE